MSKRVIRFGVNKIAMSIKNLMKMSVLFYMLMALQSHSTVHGGPTIQYLVTEPRNVTAKSGKHLTLPCDVVRKQGKCQWTKDGFGLGPDVDLPGWPRYSMIGCNLQIDPVLPEDGGLYQCQVGGVLGADAIISQPARVSVVCEPGPPYIEQAKVDDVMVAKKGEVVALDCQSQGGKPAAEILWNHKSSDNIEVTDIINTVELMSDGYSFKTMSTLKFVPKKSVRIICSAFNEEFTYPKSSRPIQITVKNKPNIGMVFDKSSITVGESLEVKCLASKLDDDLTYNWFVNNLEMEGFSDNVLKLDSVNRNQNNAEIKCVVRNSVGLTEIIKTLHVKFSPAIVMHPQSKNVRYGETVELTCAAEGNPTPKYVWFKEKSFKLVGEGQHLGLVASDETEGEYTCKVYSEGFESISSLPATVAVKRKPRIYAELVKYANIDKDVILQCKDYSFSKETKLLWTKNHDPIDPNSEKYQVLYSTEDQNLIKSDMLIFKLTNDDFGEYGCFASNEIGTDYRTISLKKEEAVTYIPIVTCINITIFLLVLLCLFIFYQRRKLLRQKEKVKKGIIQPIYKTTVMPLYKKEDIGVLDKLLLEKGKEGSKNVCEVNMALDSSFR